MVNYVCAGYQKRTSVKEAVGAPRSHGSYRPPTREVFLLSQQTSDKAPQICIPVVINGKILQPHPRAARVVQRAPQLVR